MILYTKKAKIPRVMIRIQACKC